MNRYYTHQSSHPLGHQHPLSPTHTTINRHHPLTSHHTQLKLTGYRHGYPHTSDLRTNTICIPNPRTHLKYPTNHDTFIHPLPVHINTTQHISTQLPSIYVHPDTWTSHNNLPPMSTTQLYHSTTILRTTHNIHHIPNVQCS